MKRLLLALLLLVLVVCYVNAQHKVINKQHNKPKVRVELNLARNGEILTVVSHFYYTSDTYYIGVLNQQKAQAEIYEVTKECYEQVEKGNTWKPTMGSYVGDDYFKAYLKSKPKEKEISQMEFEILFPDDGILILEQEKERFLQKLAKAVNEDVQPIYFENTFYLFDDEDAIRPFR